MSFLMEAQTNYQRGFSRIPAHCLTRPLVAAGNDKTSAPDMHQRAQHIKFRCNGSIRHLRKSILTAKSTFVPQVAAFRAALRTEPYSANEEPQMEAEAAEDTGESQKEEPHLMLMHRFSICNMLGDRKTHKMGGICTGSALHFEKLF